ncbi:MAG: hypothetical protein II750_06270, partial [Bacteroidaceae bacterium]|nr:hypothetical protein [Bacteroidaceae bacterium]
MNGIIDDEPYIYIEIAMIPTSAIRQIVDIMRLFGDNLHKIHSTNMRNKRLRRDSNMIVVISSCFNTMSVMDTPTAIVAAMILMVCMACMR